MGNIVLDVREIDKKFRKKTILGLFNDLSDNHELELISDHSLAPLNKLFQKEKNGFFQWAEIESGPQIWRITIKKIKSLNLTINDILRQYPLASDIFENRGISYYKLGNAKLSDLSEEAQKLFDEIRAKKTQVVNPLRTDYWSISFTIDYIINNHHTFVKECIPEIESLIGHLAHAHASSQPQFPMISLRFNEFKSELEEHMKDEEEIVFPSFKKLEKTLLQGNDANGESFKDAISWMEEDHILTGTTLRSMRNFCNNYVAPEDSSPGFKILYEELKKFESDLHFHMHLENNVLFAKVMALFESIPKRH